MRGWGRRRRHWCLLLVVEDRWGWVRVTGWMGVFIVYHRAGGGEAAADDKACVVCVCSSDLELVILDIFYSSIRISIKTTDNINKFLSGVYQLNSKGIVKILLEQYYEKDNFEFITKIKNKDNIIDVDDFDIRFRKTKEKDLNVTNY